MRIVESEDLNIEDKLFNEIFPDFYSNLIQVHPGKEVPILLREKVTSKGRPKKQPRLKSVVEFKRLPLKKSKF